MPLPLPPEVMFRQEGKPGSEMRCDWRDRSAVSRQPGSAALQPVVGRPLRGRLSGPSRTSQSSAGPGPVTSSVMTKSRSAAVCGLKD